VEDLQAADHGRERTGRDRLVEKGVTIEFDRDLRVQVSHLWT
jgi:hypothetical protein